MKTATSRTICKLCDLKLDASHDYKVKDIEFCMNSNNFINLFELYVSDAHTVAEIVSENYNIKNRMDFLNKLVVILEENTPQSKRIIEVIKRQKWEEG